MNKDETVRPKLTRYGLVALPDGSDTTMPVEHGEFVKYADVLAAIPLLSPSGWEIKRLEWRAYDTFPAPTWMANTPFGFYEIEERAGSDVPSYALEWSFTVLTIEDSLDEAKATAQADFEQRIRSALLPPALTGRGDRMGDLLGNSAVITPDGLYRHRLDRYVQPLGFVFAYFGVNGSTAGPIEEDQTTRKWFGFTLRNDGSRYIAANPFGYRATDVRRLAEVADPATRNTR